MRTHRPPLPPPPIVPNVGVVLDELCFLESAGKDVQWTDAEDKADRTQTVAQTDSGLSAKVCSKKWTENIK